jgi:hypothetical protein
MLEVMIKAALAETVPTIHSTEEAERALFRNARKIAVDRPWDTLLEDLRETSTTVICEARPTMGALIRATSSNCGMLNEHVVLTERRAYELGIIGRPQPIDAVE